MSTFTLEYGKGPKQVEVCTVDELDRALDRAEIEASAQGVGYETYIFTEAFESGPVLHLGIGRPDMSFLTCGSVYVRGDLDHGEPTEWYYGNQLGEIPPGGGIPNKVAREAAREFVRTGGRPSNVEWVEDE